MICKTLLLSFPAACTVLLVSCQSPSAHHLDQQFGESVVFVGHEPAALAHPPLRSKSVSVRDTYAVGKDTVHYAEDLDFVIDYTNGTLCRTVESRLPDFRTNILFSQEAFDHSKFPGFGNKGYFAFVDYSFARATPWPVQKKQAKSLKATKAKLKTGKEVRIVAFGDSITAGGDATRPELVFWQRWVDYLKVKYPRARITALNGATGGDSTVQGLQRLQTKVLDERPDLVLIGFGMNDHNLSGVPVAQFERNLREMIERIRLHAGAEIILFSAFPPNPKWKFGTHRMEEYAASTARVAQETRCAYADVFNNWQTVACRKKPEDLLGNNINHPNDFGHWIYFRVFQELGL